MRIAIFYNWMDHIGGAEIFTLRLARELGAHIYTTNIDPEKIRLMGFADILPKIHSIGRVPTNAPFRHQAALRRFARLNLGDTYEFYIICGDWAMSGARHNKPNLWYVHSPLNELWQWKDFVRQQVVRWWQRPFFDIWVAYNRWLTRRYACHVERWACNSLNTQSRIRRYYGREAAVLYPPTDTTKYSSLQKEIGETVFPKYWLSVNRLTAHKRVELQLAAFAQMPNERFIIVGAYEEGASQFEHYRKHLEALRPANVHLLHGVDDPTLAELYMGARGFITTARDEDFGLTAVEAMAAGKPVIAPREGGYVESIIDGVTGILIDDIDVDKLVAAIERIDTELTENPARYMAAARAQADLFAIDSFVADIHALLAMSPVAGTASSAYVQPKTEVVQSM